MMRVLGHNCDDARSFRARMCTHTHTHTHTHTRAHAHTQTRTRTRTHTHKHAHTHTHTHEHAHRHERAHPRPPRCLASRTAWRATRPHTHEHRHERAPSPSQVSGLTHRLARDAAEMRASFNSGREQRGAHMTDLGAVHERTTGLFTIHLSQHAPAVAPGEEDRVLVGLAAGEAPWLALAAVPGREGHVPVGPSAALAVAPGEEGHVLLVLDAAGALPFALPALGL